MNADQNTLRTEYLDHVLDAGVPEAALEETNPEYNKRSRPHLFNPGASYRRFRVHNAGDGYTLYIEEVDPTDVRPGHWTDGAKTRETAWSIARQFKGDTVYTDRDGGRKNLGNLYDAEYVESLYAELVK